MKFPVRFFSIVLLFALMATVTNAQRGGMRNADPVERANQQTAQMTEKLSLSTKQSEKVGEINLKYANKLKEVVDGMGEDSDWSAMRETIKGIRMEQNEEMKTVLTTAQMEQWQKIQEERRSQRQGRRSERGPREKENKTQENQN